MDDRGVGRRSMTDIFISYSMQSKAETEQLARGLQAKGFTVWYDTKFVEKEVSFARNQQNNCFDISIFVCL
jgi:hypothetical protein